MTARRLTTALALGALVVGTAACDLDRPPISTSNIGFRGISMGTVVNPRDSAANYQEVVSAIPDDIPEISGEQAQRIMPDGTFQNVEVLGNLSVPEFNRTMVAMTNWVSPEQGCNYCHYVDPQGNVNMAAENRYTKHVSRRMIQMVKYINEEWSSHVGEEGVNCWTCHVGQPQPSRDRVWSFDDEEPNLRYYLDRDDVRVQGEVALASEGPPETSIQNARNTYWFMIHTSNALGVNCTYCHNSARLADWEESPPARVTALRGYRMVREINSQFVHPLGDQLQFPDSVLGPQGDVPKVMCTTCHQGIPIPQYGMSRATGYPGLLLPEAVNPPAQQAALPATAPEVHQGTVGGAP